MLFAADFHLFANAYFVRISDALEALDASGKLELEAEPDRITIILPQNKTLLLSKHGVTQQLWLSSPISGGLHFIYDREKKNWLLPDGRDLLSVMTAELKALAQLEVNFP